MAILIGVIAFVLSLFAMGIVLFPLVASISSLKERELVSIIVIVVIISLLTGWREYEDYRVDQILGNDEMVIQTQ